MKKQIIILGDTEMGGGTVTDDFVCDKTISQLINTLGKRKHRIDLILNGDTFDFLKCPYIKDGKRMYPRHITETVSLSKLQLIYHAHKFVFDALKNFVRKPQHRLFFIIGNHDHDLFYKKVQTEIKKILHSQGNVFFKLTYKQHRVHAEHGHQYDFLNKINPDQPLLLYKNKFILNIPWVSLGIVSRFMTLKEKHPFLERIKPYPTLFSHDKAIVQELSRRGMEYFLKGMIYYPIRFFYDPTYAFPKEIARELYRRWKDRHWDVDEIVEKFKRRNARTMKKNQLYVFGHIHERYLEHKAHWTMIHPDTWRDEYILDKKTKLLTPKVKSYVCVTVFHNDELQWEVVEIPNERSTLNFYDVVKQEKEYLGIVKKEEGK